MLTAVLAIVAVTTLLAARPSSSARACSASPPSASSALALYRAFGGERGDDPARMIARATLVLLVLVAALGAATGVGLIAALGGGPAIAVTRRSSRASAWSSPACSAGRDGSSFP